MVAKYELALTEFNHPEILPSKIILDDITVSRNHGFISVDDDLDVITDEKSTNGIFVNGELIGGCDIAMELHNNGELKEIFEKVE